jgi:palmitoyl-protein thioesterase
MPGKVRNLLSIGGPNMGVADLPHCFSGKICTMINYVVRQLVYFTEVQDIVGPAGYFRDPHHMDQYLSESVFLRFLNNEAGEDADKASIKARFTALNGLMNVMFDQDTMVYPKESEWFQELNKLEKVEPLAKSDWYNNDVLGLKTLTDAGKVKNVKVEGDHLQFTAEDISNTFVPFLLS